MDSSRQNFFFSEHFDPDLREDLSLLEPWTTHVALLKLLWPGSPLLLYATKPFKKI